MPFLPLHDDNPRILIQHAWVTWGLIAVCSFVFLVEVSLPPEESGRLIYGLGLIPATLSGEGKLMPDLYIVPPAVTLVSAMFIHGGWMHLIGNMLYLWVFGDNVEDSMGHVRFLIFYLTCGVIAALVHFAVDPGSVVPTVGASGAISGVLGAYLLLHPRARVLVPVIVIPLYVPAYLLLIVWILFQLVSAAAGGTAEGGIAWWEHIGGFAAGALLVVFFRRRSVPLFGRGDLPRGVRLRTGGPASSENSKNGRQNGPWS